MILARTGLAIIVSVVGLGATACDESEGGTGGTSDALYPVGDSHHLCAPSKRLDTFTEGLDAFGNRGPAPVTITKVEWPTTGDVAADSIRVFQRQSGDKFASLGLVGGLPEKLRGSPGDAWERSVAADGATLPDADPDDGGYLLFAIGVRGTEGSGGPLTVHYVDAAGKSGSATSLVELRVAEKC